MHRLLRLFFYLLYHPFAGAYDLVAALVSFGKWREWVFSVLPYVEGERVLELGHGPGHLQKALQERGCCTFGLDTSRQMGKLALRKLGKSPRLVRAKAQALPFADESFSCVVATFPTEYILDPSTLEEIQRVLRNGGRVIVLPGVRFDPTIWVWKLVNTLWRSTGQDTIPPLPKARSLEWEEKVLPKGAVEVILWLGRKSASMHQEVINTL